MNCYVVLGIAEDADRETIRAAFRVLARRYHPDAGAGSSAAEFRRVLQAYETLIDPDCRRLHDRELHALRRRHSPPPEPLFGPTPFAAARHARPGTEHASRRVAVAFRGSPPTDELLESLLAFLESSFGRPPWK